MSILRKRERFPLIQIVRPLFFLKIKYWSCFLRKYSSLPLTFLFGGGLKTKSFNTKRGSLCSRFPAITQRRCQASGAFPCFACSLLLRSRRFGFWSLFFIFWRGCFGGVAKNKMCPQTHWRYFSSPKIYFVISWIALSFFCLACFSKSFASIHNLTISFCLGRSGTGIVIFKNS